MKTFLPYSYPLFARTSYLDISMDSINMFRQRLNWTRGWLHTFTASQITITDDFEVVPLPVGDIASSDFGVESLNSDALNPSGAAALSRCCLRLHACTCSAHSCHKCRFRPGSCDGKCPFCTEARFHLEGRAYCQECNGACTNDRPEDHPDDASDIDTVFKSDRKELVNYEFTTRGATNTFQDMRSASKARKRKRRENEKYFHYEAVKPGWLGRNFYSARNLGQTTADFGGVLLRDAPVETMTKAMMYKEAQRYPRPPKYHHRHVDKIRDPYNVRRKGWRHCDSRKHAKNNLEIDMFDGRVEADFEIANWTCPCCPWGQDGSAQDTEVCWLEPMTNDWCDICDVHWGSCDLHQQQSFGDSRCVVDEVYELRIETDENTGRMKVMFEMDPWEVDRSNRAPATIPYGKRDWVLHPYPEHFTEDDLSWWD